MLGTHGVAVGPFPRSRSSGSTLDCSGSQLDAELSLKTERTDVGDVAVLGITGKLAGGEEAEELRNAVAALVREKAKKVLIDLSGVPWMNSSGVGALVSAYTSLRNGGAHIRFLNLNERVRAI